MVPFRSTGGLLGEWPECIPGEGRLPVHVGGMKNGNYIFSLKKICTVEMGHEQDNLPILTREIRLEIPQFLPERREEIFFPRHNPIEHHRLMIITQILEQ
jgi:hypothetical protein